MENRLKAIFKASIVAILVNIAIGIFKAIVGVISNSIAITMDAINNFTDAGSSFITILSSYFATKESDKKHPFGYGRTEYLGTLLIAGLILYAGVTAFVESVKKIFNPEIAEYTTASLIIIIFAVVAKTLLTLYISKVGKKVNSDSLIAAAKESIGDIAISIATIVAALVYIFVGLSIEAYIGAIIAALIIRAGVEILIETVGKILGTGADASLVTSIKKAISEYEGVIGAYDLVLNNYGPDTYLASVHIEVEDTMPIGRFDELSRIIQNDILEKFGIYLSAIGVYSINTNDNDIINIREEIKKTALSNEFVNQIHGFYIDKVNKSMRFDLVISFNAKDRRQVYLDVLKDLADKYPEYKIDAGLDSDFNEI